jgi:hypothetical protein
MEEREKDLRIFQEQNLKNFLEKRMKVLLRSNFWRLFNLILVEKCESEELRKVLQQAVLGQFKLVQNHNKDLLCETDELGRNSFHFMLPLYKRKDEIKKELSQYTYSILNKGLKMRDDLFSKTPVDYLLCYVRNMSLLDEIAFSFVRAMEEEKLLNSLIYIYFKQYL